ncbi:MAG: oligosaccharide flippase family protein, partial [Armatimonadia bacterium]
MSEPGISHDKALNTENLGSRTRTAIGWKLLSQIMATGLHMVASIILARLLMPKDFGILGMATMVTGLAGIFRDLGLGQALVQRKDLDRDHLASAYWGTLVMGGLLTGLTLL